MYKSRSYLAGALAALLVAVGAASAQDNPPGSPIIVPLNSTVRLQMTTKAPIRRVVNPKENALTIRTIPQEPNTILLVGQQPDVTRIELTDTNGRTETYEVIIQADVEYLRTQLRRAVPTANVTPVPTSSNTVILAGTVTRAEDIQTVMAIAQSIGFQTVNAMRVGGVQQVQLDVIVVRVARSDLRTMAFNFLTNARAWYLGSTVGNAVAEPAGVGVGSALNATFNGAQALAGAPGTPNGVPTNLPFGILNNRAGFLGFLEALRTENLAKLIAEPRLVTLSGRPGSFLSGGEQAVPVPAGLGQVGVQFEEFGTRLNFLPVVLGNGKIHLEVEPEVSQLDAASGVSIQGTVVPGRLTTRSNVTIELEAGQTFVIGGLIQNQVTATDSKVPFLGDIPFLGAAFSSKAYNESEQEVLILVTPWLVDAEACDQRPPVLPGMETRRPDDFELFLEGIIEAPRGPREVCRDNRYVAPYKNSPSAADLPCAGSRYGLGGNGSCGCGNGCGGGCGETMAPMPAPAMAPHGPLSTGPLSEAPRPVPLGGSGSEMIPSVTAAPNAVPGNGGQR